MSCDLIYSSLNRLAACVETTEGSRLATHCLYPSFDPVHVFVAKVGEGFKVHDGSGAFRAAWLHGRDDLLIKRAIDAECKRFHAKRVEEAIAIEIESEDWLPSAILSVANASSLAAHTAVARITAAAETVLVDEIHSVASALFGLSNVDKEVDLRGKSGGKRRYDVVIHRRREHLLLINGVLPHHNSISSKYVSFSDTDVPRENRLAVHDRELGAGDIALLQQVSHIVPMLRLRKSPQEVLANAS